MIAFDNVVAFAVGKIEQGQQFVTLWHRQPHARLFAMPYHKGVLSKRRKLLEWPHHVLVPTPELGHGARLNDMHDFCRGMDYKTASASGPGKPDAVWWCFKSGADADAFKARWADIIAMAR